MAIQPSTRISPAAALVTVADAVYAPTILEHTFDRMGSENGDVAQNHAESTPHLLTAQSRRGADIPALREDTLALKTAQLVAAHLADEARATMARLGPEFSPNAFVRQAARLIAAATAPTLQPLKPARRLSVAGRMVDPEDLGADLDLVLDGVGRVLHTYCRYLPSPEWAPLPTDQTGTADARVVGWRSRDGSVILDLLDTFGADRSPDDHRAEIVDVLRVGRHQFGVKFAAVRFYPAYAMRQTRYYRPDGRWVSYRAHPTHGSGEAA